MAKFKVGKTKAVVDGKEVVAKAPKHRVQRLIKTTKAHKRIAIVIATLVIIGGGFVVWAVVHNPAVKKLEISQSSFNLAYSNIQSNIENKSYDQAHSRIDELLNNKLTNDQTMKLLQLRSFIYETQKDWQKAIADLEAVVKIYPPKTAIFTIYDRLGVDYAKLNQKDRAIDYWNKAITDRKKYNDIGMSLDVDNYQAEINKAKGGS